MTAPARTLDTECQRLVAHMVRWFGLERVTAALVRVIAEQQAERRQR